MGEHWALKDELMGNILSKMSKTGKKSLDLFYSRRAPGVSSYAKATLLLAVRMNIS